MKVGIEVDPDTIKFILDVEDDDLVNPSEKVSLGEKQVVITLPDGVDGNEIHADHLALATLLITHPFIGKSVVMPKPVSKRFNEAQKVISRYSIENVDEDLEPWDAPKNSRPGLAYSGGVDSTAALALLPPTTVPIFLDRPIHGRSLYKKDAALRSCLEVSRLGYNMYIVNCDLEYVRKPVGFPVDVANAVPAILLAKHLRLDSIAFGTILESGYGIGHAHFREYSTGSHYRLWGGLFAAAGLPFNLPVIGISEVGTSIICAKSPIGGIAQSCMRGEWKNPCQNCWKCFRKTLLDQAISQGEFSEGELANLFSTKEAKLFVGKIPIKHENVLTWSTHRLKDKYPLLEILKQRVEGGVKSLDWLERWYSPSLEMVLEKYRNIVQTRIFRYLEKMSISDEKEVQNWNMDELIESEMTHHLSEKIIEEMGNLIQSG